jgi:hypothetical protein
MTITRNRTIWLMLMLLFFASQVSFATTSYYAATMCANGYQDAYTMTTVDDLGCLVSVHGINCSGEWFSFSGPVLPRGNDLGMSYTLYYFGTVQGLGNWYVKIQVSDPGIARAWGKKADGTYYEMTL